MSISPQLVCMTSVAGLLGGSSVVGLGMCCGPLLVAFAALHAPAEPPADVVAVVLAAPFAAERFDSSFLAAFERAHAAWRGRL